MQIKLKALSFQYSVFVLVILNLLLPSALVASDFGDISIKTKGCLSNIKSLPHYSDLSKLNEADIAKWKDQKSDSVTPKHDFVFVSEDNVLKHTAVTYYLDSISRIGFVMVKASIADMTDWYGSFHLNDEIVNCINLTKTK